MNRDNQPVFNVNRKVANFGDYCNNIDSEEQELKKVDRSFIKNGERQQFPNNSKYKFNKVTRKMDDLSKDMIDDDIDAIEELEITENTLPNLFTGSAAEDNDEEMISEIKRISKQRGDMSFIAKGILILLQNDAYFSDLIN